MRSFEKLCFEVGVDDLTQEDVNVSSDIYAERAHLPGDLDDV